MKTHLALLLTLGLGTLPLAAAPGHDHDHDFAAPEWAEAFGQVPLTAVWQILRDAEAAITAALARRRFDALVDPAETLHLAAHALLEKVRLPDEGRQIRLAAALNQAARLADEVQAHARTDQPDHAAAAFGRLRAAIHLARLRLLAEITGG
jgi:hypothetical protein